MSMQTRQEQLILIEQALQVHVPEFLGYPAMDASTENDSIRLGWTGEKFEVRFFDGSYTRPIGALIDAVGGLIEALEGRRNDVRNHSMEWAEFYQHLYPSIKRRGAR